MKKLIVLFMMLVCINIVTAIEFPAGEAFTLYSIDKCEGPVFIKMTSTQGMSQDDFNIEKCTQISLVLWECKCVHNFDVKILTKKSLVKEYDVLIQYFLEYDDIPQTINGTPSIDYIVQQNKIRSHSMLNINIAPSKYVKLPFSIDIKMKNAVVVSVIFFIGIILFFVLRYKNEFSKGGDTNNDLFNYKTKHEEDIQDILDTIE